MKRVYGTPHEFIFLAILSVQIATAYSPIDDEGFPMKRLSIFYRGKDIAYH